MPAVPLIHRLRCAREGSTIVEFAIVAPILMAFSMMSIEFGYSMMARSALEGATAQAARTALASTDVSQADRDAAMRSAIAETMANFAPARNETIQIDVSAYGTFGGVGRPEPFDDVNKNGTRDSGESFVDLNGNCQWENANGVQGSLGNPGDVVRYTATYPLQPLFGQLTPLPEDEGFVALTASAVVRNEPDARYERPCGVS